MRNLDLRFDDPILPAGTCLFGKVFVSVDDMATEWDSGTIYVHKKDGKHKFVYSSGDLSKTRHYVGAIRGLVHDQTHKSMGAWEIVGIIRYKGGEVKTEGEDHTARAYPMAVYK